jgi:AraC family transcriptional regulator, positive regulator of tynA and feaB
MNTVALWLNQPTPDAPRILASHPQSPPSPAPPRPALPLATPSAPPPLATPSAPPPLATPSPAPPSLAPPDQALSGQDSFAQLVGDWQKRMGAQFVLPQFSSSTLGGFRGRVRASRLFDVVLADIEAVSPMRATAVTPADDLVRLYVIERGTCVRTDPSGHGEHILRAGDFVLEDGRHGKTPFRTSPHSSAHVATFPAEGLAPLLRHGARMGRADAPEMRLLLAHARLVQSTVDMLKPPGAQAARAALLELVKGVAGNRVDDSITPALVQAARHLADSRLTDPALTSAAVARDLHISLRTLQRAFAQQAESFTDYVRRRRLEEAHRALLTAPSTVSELAARFQFADSSHFVRAFRRRYGHTPATSRSCPCPRDMYGLPPTQPLAAQTP